MDIIQRNEAKEKGLKFYFTNKPCKHGHINSRRVSNGVCKICELSENQNNGKDRQDRFREAHPYEKTKLVNKTDDPNYFKNWNKTNKDKVSKYNKSTYAKKAKYNWRQNNKGHQKFLTRKRQKCIKRATPCWANQEAIKQLYIAASEKSTNECSEYQIDHIIPIQGELVCGLHVENNLQILSKTKNLSKGNQFLVE